MGKDATNRSKRATLRTQQLFGQLNAILFPAASRLLNLRIAYYDVSVDPARPEYNEHVIFLPWHEYISVVLPRWNWTPLTLLVSHHRDGEWLNQIAENLGYGIVRGSTSRGGSRAIRELRRRRKETSLVITPDGPRGPRRETALGPVYLASLLKMPIVPVGIGLDRPWRLNTWDRFAIPRPFSRARILFGPKIRIPPKLDRHRLEQSRRSIQQLTLDLTHEAEKWAREGHRLAGQRPFCRVRRCRQLRFPDPRKQHRRLFTNEIAPRDDSDSTGDDWRSTILRAVAS